MLPADGHVHTQWSWDAPAGDMERSCARAVELGLPSIAFTDHADFTTWDWPAGTISPGWRATITSDGMLAARPFPVEEYLDSVQRCREMFTDLRILSGVELSEPHWHPSQIVGLLSRAGFDRVLGSVHSLAAGDRPHAIGDDTYTTRSAADVIRAYLAETTSMIKTCDQFSVLAHIDYPVRHWPVGAGPFDPVGFEDEYRETLRTLADTGRALEINTQLPLGAQIVQWWHEVGGDAVTFGSDAHDPDTVARGFTGAAAMAEAHGFRPGRDPFALWGRA